jgi:hypothetical protein
MNKIDTVMMDKIQASQQLVSLSQSMLEKARSDCWDDVCVLETDRNELIKIFFLEPIQQAHMAAIAANIQSIIAIDQDLISLGLQKKLELAEILRTMEQGKKAVKAYSS